MKESADYSGSFACLVTYNNTQSNINSGAIQTKVNGEWYRVRKVSLLGTNRRDLSIFETVKVQWRCNAIIKAFWAGFLDFIERSCIILALGMNSGRWVSTSYSLWKIFQFALENLSQLWRRIIIGSACQVLYPCLDIETYTSIKGPLFSLH